MGVIGVVGLVGAVVAWRTGSSVLLFFFGTCGLGVLVYAASLLVAAAGRQGVGWERGPGTVRIGSSSAPWHGRLGAAVVLLVGGIVGLGTTWPAGFQLLLPSALGAVGLVETLRRPRERPSITLNMHQIRLDTSSAWVEVDWNLLQRAATDTRGDMILLWVHGTRDPVPFPAGELTMPPAAVAELLQRLARDPSERARLLG